MLDTLKVKRADLVTLCEHHHVRKLNVFGSAANGEFDGKESDLDFLVTFEPCSPADHYERYFGLLEDLEALFGRHVDLVEESAMRNPYFVREVQASRQSLYAA